MPSGARLARRLLRVGEALLVPAPRLIDSLLD